MYLNLLTDEEKRLFLELEIYMSKEDSEFSAEEKDIIDAHCLEMHIDSYDYECTRPLINIISELSEKCTDSEKRIIFLELVAVVLADGLYHEAERAIIEQIKNYFGLNDNDEKEAFDIINALKNNYERCANFIKEK